MLTRLQRSAVGLATALGYIPTDGSWRNRLVELRGEFRRSVFEKVLRYTTEAMAIGFGAWLLGSVYRSYVRGDDGPWPYFGAMSLLLIALGFYGASKNGTWYRFESGSVTAFNGVGKALWHENLNGLKEVLCARGRGTAVMTLVWEDHKRRMELYSSLEKAIRGRAPSPESQTDP